jgi:type II secretory pathway pseudopilin PulG
MKTAKFLHAYPVKSKSGFTLIELLIVMVIIIILAGVIVMAVGGVFGNARSAAYNTAKDQIQKAVTSYTANKASLLPTLAGSYTNAECQNCKVVDLNALLTANDGMLRQAPTGINLSADLNDNCGGNASLGCKSGNSYIWILNSQGNVYSYCMGPECKTNNSGYQNVWP